jgi:hypothetical protein
MLMLRHACEASVFLTSGADRVSGCPNLVELPGTSRNATSIRHYRALHATGAHERSSQYSAKRLVQFCGLPMVRRVIRRNDRSVLVLGWIERQCLAKAKDRPDVHMDSTSSDNGSGARSVRPGPCLWWLCRNVDVAHMLWPWRAPALACVFFWLLGPAFIFGRDLMNCLRKPERSDFEPTRLIPSTAGGFRPGGTARQIGQAFH